MAVVTTLTANLTAKTATFDRKMRKSQKNMKSFNATSKALSSTLLKFGTGLIAAVGIRGIARYTMSTMAAIDATAKLSDRLQIATEDIIGLRHAAEIMGSSGEAMDKSLEMFVRRLGEVRQGTGEAKRALEELGLDVNKLVDLSPAKAFRQIADEINNMTTQADKAAAAYQLFGRQGVKLLNTMSLGADGLEKMQVEAEKLGLTFSRMDAAKVEEANDAIQRMKETFTGLGQEIAIEAAPAIEKFTNKISEMIKAHRDWQRAIADVAGTAPIEIIRGTDIELAEDRVEHFTNRLEELKSLGGAQSPLRAVREDFKLVTGFVVEATQMLAKFKKEAGDIARAQGQAELFAKSIVGVKKLNAGLKDQIRLFGMTANEKAIDKLKQLGAELTGLQAYDFGRFISQSERMAEKLEDMGEAAAAVKRTADQMERMKNLARDLVNSLKTNKQQFDEFAKMIQKLVTQGLLTVPQQIEILKRKTDELFDTSRVKNFADAVKQSLKSPIMLMRDFRSELKEAFNLGFLNTVEVAAALRKKAAELFPTADAVSPARIDRGESQQVRTAFVNVAALTSANLNPQVKEQQRTNSLLELNNRILMKIEMQEIG